KKPLYYCIEGKEFAFASEIKAFATLESSEVNLCEKLEFYFDEYTPFRNTWNVKPGEFVTYDTTSDRIERTIWWRFPEYDGSVRDMNEAQRAFLPLLEDACRIR